MTKYLLNKNLPIFIVIIIFSVYAVIINTMLLEGSNLNRNISAHDEYLTVSEVYNIINPASVRHGFMAVVSGDIQYYGRFMFYCDALIAYIPYKIWGLEGAIFTIRLTHQIFLTAGIMLLGLGFLKNNTAKVMFFTGAFFCYYTFYFTAIPKPESYQLFFLALFFIQFSKKEYSPGKYFIWLGIAFGLKFNIVVFFPILFLIIMTKGHTKNFWKGVLFFLIGFLISNPYIILGFVKPIFFQTYLNNTIYFVNNVDDSSDVNFWSWFWHVFPNIYFGNRYVFIFTLAILTYLIVKLTNKEKINVFVSPHLMFLLCGSLLLLSIMVFTKRLYAHYLYLGYIFIILSLIMLTFELIINSKIKIIAISIIVFGSVTYFAYPKTSILKERIHSKETSLKQYNIIKHLLSSKSDPVIVQDIGVYYKFDWLVTNFVYHPFKGVPPRKKKCSKVKWDGTLSSRFIAAEMADFIIVSDFFRQTKYADSKDVFLKDTTLLEKYKLISRSGGLSVYSKIN